MLYFSIGVGFFFMIFVTGGYCAGKKHFVIEKFGYNRDDFSNKLDDCKKIVYNVEDIHFIDIDETFDILSKKDIVICNELGCGVIPIDNDLRIRRELIGKLCIKLANHADEVYRVYTGIGVKIK